MEKSGQDQKNLEKLVGMIREMNRRGENPATSGNYSYRLQEKDQTFAVSESGVDKAEFQLSNWVEVDNEGRLSEKAEREGKKSSAETELHLMIYRLFPRTHCVLHSHGLSPLLYVETEKNTQSVNIEEMEMLKTLSGFKTHDTRVEIPVCDNSQNMQEIICSIEGSLTSPNAAPSFIIRRHGLYTWGDTVEEAWRHLEALNYLFSFELEKKKLSV